MNSQLLVLENKEQLAKLLPHRFQMLIESQYWARLHPTECAARGFRLDLTNNRVIIDNSEKLATFCAYEFQSYPKRIIIQIPHEAIEEKNKQVSIMGTLYFDTLSSLALKVIGVTKFQKEAKFELILSPNELKAMFTDQDIGANAA